MKTLGFVAYGTGEFEPFDQVFDLAKLITYSNMHEVKDLDAIVIWGGADISPSIYKEPVSQYTGAGEGLSARDAIEVKFAQTAIEHGVPIIGVCRGAQLACALAGGKLVQHVNGHGRDHAITTKDGRQMITSSVHHQMMYPWDVEHDLIAWTTENRSSTYIGGNNEEMVGMHERGIEPEIVYFPKIKALAIQGHPEFMRPDCTFVKYCMDLTRKYITHEETVSV